MFKKRRGIHIPYNKQGLIYFTCMDIKNQPQEIKKKVLVLCSDIAGVDADALYEVMTNDSKSIQNISKQHYVSEKKLYKMRKEFYEKW